MDTYDYLGKVLGVEKSQLERLDSVMAERTGRADILEKVRKENEDRISTTLALLGATQKSASHVREVLKNAVLAHEAQLLSFLTIIEGQNQFEKAAKLAKKIAKSSPGFFLKRQYAEEILRKRRPENLLKYLGYANVDELFEKNDVLEAFSALRFVESDEWMHQTFEEAYSAFTPADFEEREIEIKVLGSEWHEIAAKFVAKKHHNVSHLKEFGVIFINPIQEDVQGKFLRDFALLLHYFHEVEFYSKLFKKYSWGSDFAVRLKALLRGDVKEVSLVGDGSPSQVSQSETWEGKWLIVQRYLFKENPSDPRLFLPRVNPESMHWLRGERDLALFSGAGEKLDMKLWHNLDWVGGLFDGEKDEIVSFDLEDNAMAAVSFIENKNEFFTYHQREALWTKIFMEYVGGEEEMERLLIENFDKGVIKF